MKPIKIFGTSNKSRIANVSAQTRVNLYLEQSDDKSPIVAYGTPGLTEFINFGSTPIRALHVIDSILYVVHRDKFYSVTAAGDVALKGTLLTSTGTIGIDDNGLQIIIVDGDSGYIYTLASGAFVEITDADFPGASSVTENDGFFIVNKPDTGQFYISQSYDGLVWDALDFATAEANSDKLRRVYANQGRVILFGDLSIEFWIDSGALDFPYTRISSTTSEWGIAAVNSVADINNSVMFLAKSRQGEVQVMWLNGYGLQRVSTFDIENIFNGYSSVSEATAFSYLYNGHPFYQINFTTANTSWLYDMASGVWSQLKSGTGRHRSEIGVTFESTIKTTDYESGKIYTINDESFDDDGEAVIMELTTPHPQTGLERSTISELQVDAATGQGVSTGQGVTPRIMMQTSKDGGNTWGNERFANIGAIGEHKARAKFTRLGQARDWSFKFSISDPVKRAILGVYING